MPSALCWGPHIQISIPPAFIIAWMKNSLGIPFLLPMLAEYLHTPYAVFLNWDSVIHPSQMNKELICFSTWGGGGK